MWRDELGRTMKKCRNLKAGDKLMFWDACGRVHVGTVQNSPKIVRRNHFTGEAIYGVAIAGVPKDCLDKEGFYTFYKNGETQVFC